MSFRHRPLMTSVYEWHCSRACTSTLVMGRTLDLPSVIELAPCKYKRVYFYFGVQKKLIFIYVFFFILIFGADLTFILRPIWLGADMTGNRIEYVALQMSLLQFYNTTEKTYYVCYVACVLLSTNNNTYRTDPCCIMLLFIILLSNVISVNVQVCKKSSPPPSYANLAPHNTKQKIIYWATRTPLKNRGNSSSAGG